MLVVKVDACEALRHIEALACPGDGYVELAGILGNGRGIVAVEVAWIAVLHGIEDNDIIEFQSFCFVYRRNEDTVFDVMAITKISLLQSIDFYDVGGQLLTERLFILGVEEFFFHIVQYIVQLSYGLNHAGFNQVVVETL